jgi:eukaryotic-like serine/threonine-protein kinase
MDTNGNGPAPGSRTARVEADGEQRTCMDGSSERDDAVTIDSIPSLASTEAGEPRSTLELPGEDGGGHTQVSVGSTYDAESTAYWDSQATVPSWAESTIGAWKTTVPLAKALSIEAVPGFEILSELGRGGMGVVYKARQMSLKRIVALKMIRDDWLGNPEHLARFEIEAEAVARLSHPNILGIYEIGKVGRVPYVVLELLEGGTLKERLASTPQPFRDAAALLATLARGVHFAHGAGILHRDLKPSNVLFDQAGVPKIADFGLAKRLEVDEGQTQTGQVIGTPSYMAPEQARGWDRDIGATADIYSLGAILYEMLTGRPPLKGSTAMETLKLVQEEDPVPPSRLRPKLPFDLETICLKCLNRDPRKRYPDALSLAEDLDRFLAGESVLARRTPPWERAIKRARKRPVTVVLLAVSAVCALYVVEEVLRARAHERAREEKEYARVTDLLEAAQPEIFDAERALAQGHWTTAQGTLTRFLDRIAKDFDPRIAATRERAEELHAKARLGLEEEAATEEARARLRRFAVIRDEAIFLETTRYADRVGIPVETTCRAARDGLQVFGEARNGDDWDLSPLPAALSLLERDEVKSGFYQLLLILADAVAQSPGAAPAQRAEEALRIINRAEGLLARPTRAFHLRRADFLAMKGDHGGAGRERAVAEGFAPADDFDFFLMGREAVRRSAWAGAIEPLMAATQGPSDHFWPRCLLAICYLQTGEPGTAWVALNTCLEQKPDRPWLYILRGNANTAVAGDGKGQRDPDRETASLERFRAAEADFRRAIELLGDGAKHTELHYKTLVSRGLMWLVRNDLENAAGDFRAAIHLIPGRDEAFADLGQVYQRQGRTNEALQQFAKALELRPKWAPLYRGRAHIFLGVTDLSPELREMTLSKLEDVIGNLSQQRRDAAFRDLASAIRYESPGNHLIAADWLKSAALLRTAGRHKDALGACDAALKIAERYAAGHELRIKLLLDLKKFDELIESCNAVLQWLPASARIYELRGIAKNAIGDFSGAIGDFTRSIELSGEDDRPRLLCYRGWTYEASTAHRPAFQDFEAAIRLAPANAEAYLGRGMVRARLGQYRDAEIDAEKARKNGDSSAKFAIRIARVYGQAAIAVSTEVRITRLSADKLVRHYQELAMKMVRTALERTPAGERATFFRQTINLTDPPLQPIRKWLEVVEQKLIGQQAPR